MKMSGGPGSLQMKMLLLLLAIAIAFSTWYYTQDLVQKLQQREKQIVQLYANSLEYISSPNSQTVDYTFPLEIIKSIDFPLVLVDSRVTPPIDSVVAIRNFTFDSTLSEQKKKDLIKQTISELSSFHQPILVRYENQIINKIYYGDSDLIKRLKFYPILQIIFAVFFIIIAYISFSYLKKNEQSNIWIGMARETAHQLGTPISSLLGWEEILRINNKEPEKVADVADEMHNDLERLNKIANRFSKIGSKTELKMENVNDIVNKVIDYFKRRLPHFSKVVEIKMEGNENVKALLNIDLFEWVLENLVKNAIDALEDKKEGRILVKITDLPKTVEIEIEDNGKGIEFKNRKDIFRPGYSTKKRGWGLGLSLAKRIIEEYHKGKIFVKQSVINQGTTFLISLNKK
jgi:two-component sensor histidine kinase